MLKTGENLYSLINELDLLYEEERAFRSTLDNLIHTQYNISKEKKREISFRIYQLKKEYVQFQYEKFNKLEIIRTNLLSNGLIDEEGLDLIKTTIKKSLEYLALKKTQLNFNYQSTTSHQLIIFELAFKLKEHFNHFKSIDINVGLLIEQEKNPRILGFLFRLKRELENFDKSDYEKGLLEVEDLLADKKIQCFYRILLECSDKTVFLKHLDDFYKKIKRLNSDFSMTGKDFLDIYLLIAKRYSFRSCYIEDGIGFYDEDDHIIEEKLMLIGREFVIDKSLDRHMKASL